MKHGNWEKFFEIFPHGTWNATQEIENYFEGRKNGVWSSFYVDSTSAMINAKNLSSLLQAKTVFNNNDPKNTRLRLVGMYLNDKRVGEWMAFDYNGSLLQKSDFSKARLLFEKSIVDSMQYNSNRKSLFIGGQSHLLKLLVSNFNSNEIYLKIIRKDSTYAIITFNINEQGKTGNIFIETNLNNKFFKEELSRLIVLTDMNWLPRVQNNLKIESTYRIRLDIIKIKNKHYLQWKTTFRILE